MPKVVRVVFIVIFFIILVILGYIGYQYFKLSNNNQGKPTLIDSGSKVIQNVSNTIENVTSLSVSSKIIIMNNATNYKLSMPSEADVEKLLDTLQIFNGNESKIEKIEISTVDNLQTGIEQRLDDKVWMKMDSRIDSRVLKIAMSFNIDTMESFQNADWNKIVSQVILTEFQIQSPTSANTTSNQRINFAGSLVKGKSESGSNKYYFEINF